MTRKEAPPISLIRWCIGRDTLDKLQRRDAQNPHLLLLVVHNGAEIERKLVPISQMMEFFAFHRAGEHRIIATIVWHKEGNIKVLKATFFGRRIGDCLYDKLDAVDDEGNFSLESREYLDALEECEIVVNVDPGHFAKAPSKLESWWVNLWYERAPRDQCQFRKRRILAYSVQPPVILVYLLFLISARILAAAFFVSIGKRGINFKPLVHPWHYETNDIWFRAKWDHKGTIFSKKKNGDEQDFLITALAPFAPIVWVILFAVLNLINLLAPAFGGFHIWTIAAMAVGIQACFSVIIYAFALFFIACFLFTEKVIVPLFSWMGRYLAKVSKYIPRGMAILFVAAFLVLMAKMGLSILMLVLFVSALTWGFLTIARHLLKKPPELPKAEFRAVLQLEYEGYKSLVCNGPLKADVRALPKDRQTIYLRFRDLKAKVCKPFALG